MCLAVPAQIVACDGDQAVADLHGSRLTIATTLVPEAGVGDWVLIHAGFAIAKLEPREAQETFAVLRQLDPGRAAAAGPTPGAPREEGR
jgi:hydrogenase expression/formation protein HypC